MVKVFFEKFLITELVFFHAYMELCIVRTESIHVCVC